MTASPRPLPRPPTSPDSTGTDSASPDSPSTDNPSPPMTSPVPEETLGPSLFGAPEAPQTTVNSAAPARPLDLRSRQVTEHIYLHLTGRTLTLFKTFRQNNAPSARFAVTEIEHPDLWRQVLIEIAKYAQKDRLVFVHHNHPALVALIRTYKQDDEVRTFIEKDRRSTLRSAPSGKEALLWQDVLSLLERGEVPRHPVGVDGHIYSASVSDGFRNYWGCVIHTPSDLVLKSGYVDIRGPGDDLISAEMVALHAALGSLPSSFRSVVYPSQDTVKFVYDGMSRPHAERDAHLKTDTMHHILTLCTKRKLSVQTGEKPNPVFLKHARAIAAHGYAGRDVL